MWTVPETEDHLVRLHEKGEVNFIGTSNSFMIDMTKGTDSISRRLKKSLAKRWVSTRSERILQRSKPCLVLQINYKAWERVRNSRSTYTCSRRRGRLLFYNAILSTDRRKQDFRPLEIVPYASLVTRLESKEEKNVIVTTNLDRFYFLHRACHLRHQPLSSFDGHTFGAYTMYSYVPTCM